MKILVTGVAGFIGMHVAKVLLERGDNVIGIDNCNDYYDPLLKYARLNQLKHFKNFIFNNGDITNCNFIKDIFEKHKPNRVVNLAAQPGVRYSLKNANAYLQSNLVGFGNILECCRHYGIEHLVYASSSSVYGANTKLPYCVESNVDHPISLYAATKKANELMAHSYSHLYQLPTTGLRYFTVYGPWGRPDMSPWLFTSAILDGRPINVFGEGKMRRDFTYVDDIAEGTVRSLDQIPTADKNFSPDNPNPGSSLAPYRVYNIGNQEPIELMAFIQTLEEVLGIDAKKLFLPVQQGDIVATYADISNLKRDIGFEPKTSLHTGIKQFVEWYKGYVRK